MAQYFTETRNCELSTLFYLETELASAWNGVTLVKSFSKAYAKDVSLPVIAVALESTESTRREIGTNAIVSDFDISIDIFATSDGMRLDLADFVTNKLKDGYTYYTYSHPSGSTSTLEKTAVGNIRVKEFVDNRRVDVSEFSQEVKDRYRHTITVTIRKS